MTAPDEFAAEHPEMVAVSAQCHIGKMAAQQFMQKGFEDLDNVLPDDDIAVFSLP